MRFRSIGATQGRRAWVILLVAAANSTMAIAGPPVYRCQEAGKVLFSDAPCVGGQVVDTTPNRSRNEVTAMRAPVQLRTVAVDACKEVDEGMSLLNDATQQAEPNSRAQAEFQLEVARKRYASLKC